ncbi:hypothetical protein [Agrobacterium radiobacter]|uniref:hypothetical protein n=1 Tax=Agrobacterium radiobacter TaxID=362 RepID=UPI003CF95B95
MFKDKKDGKWHKYNPLFHVRLIDGRNSSGIGQIYRRWDGAKWEYRQERETEEEYLDRQF